MANTHKWDLVPVYGVWLNPVTDTPIGGTVSFTVAGRITRTDGHEIYPAGATTTVTVGDTAAQDPVMREIVRAAWRATDEAAEIAATGTFDALAWDTRWTTVILPAAVFLSFPAGNDPDIVQDNIGVTVVETLVGAPVVTYSVEPLVEQLALPVPGINLGLIEVPPGSTGAIPAMYAKGIPGGVASLGADGKIPAGQLPDGVGGASTVDGITDAGTVGKAVLRAETQSAALSAVGAATAAQGAKADSAVQPAALAGYVTTTDPRLAPELVDNSVTRAKMADASVGTPELVDDSVTNAKLADASVTNAKMVSVLADKVTDGTSRVSMTVAERQLLGLLQLSGATTGQAIVFDGAVWVPQTISTGGGGATTLDGLTDVDTAGAVSGRVLTFDGTSWVPAAVAVAAAGITDASVIGRAILTAAAAADVRTTVGAVGTTDARLSDARPPVAGSVVPASIGSGYRLLGASEFTVPAGGTTGQVLGKATDADGALTWVTPSTGGGGATTLDGLTDVDTAGATAGQVLGLDAGGAWVAVDPQSGFGEFRHETISGSPAYDYSGSAPSGAAETAAVWTITRIDLASMAVTTATGVAWSDRLTASYS